ncbi:MAG TPA: hypothetical protein VFA43_22155 [Gemmatimonadaceae bacterium]|nr:hypothetical protein [Gemmatimonadaceae bacterium]
MTLDLAAMAGLWEVDLTRSHLMGPPPRRVLMKIAHDGDELKHAMLVTRPDGTEQRVVATHRPRPDGDRVVIETTYGGREFRDYWSLSDEGQTLTMAHLDDAIAGQTAVLRRLGQLPREDQTALAR